jgi:cytochrome P450
MAQCPVHAFDHNADEYAADPVAYNRAFREECPVVWSDAHGGFWAVLSHEHLARVARDDEAFSSRVDPPNRAPGTSGITIPGADHRLIPLTLDPPEFTVFRRMLNPSFSPPVVARLEAKVEALTTACIDEHVESGEVDLIEDLAWPVTAMATLAFIGLPLDEWPQYANPYHESASSVQGSAENDHGRKEKAESLERLRAVVARRRADPQDDLISRLAHAEVDGEPLSDTTIGEVCDVVLGGGVDTTAAAAGHAFDHLDRHPELRPRLVDDASLMDSFCEEIIRFHAPIQTLARTAMRDVELGGVTIRSGERVLLSWASANHDPAVFDRPDEVVIDRPANRHTSFGLGAHRCIGSSIARTEFKIMVREVLTRMGDYQLASTKVPYETVGRINGWHRMPARFTPGRRSDAVAGSRTVRLS